MGVTWKAARLPAAHWLLPAGAAPGNAVQNRVHGSYPSAPSHYRTLLPTRKGGGINDKGPVRGVGKGVSPSAGLFFTLMQYN